MCGCAGVGNAWSVEYGLYGVAAATCCVMETNRKYSPETGGPTVRWVCIVTSRGQTAWANRVEGAVCLDSLKT